MSEQVEKKVIPREDVEQLLKAASEYKSGVMSNHYTDSWSEDMLKNNNAEILFFNTANLYLEGKNKLSKPEVPWQVTKQYLHGRTFEQALSDYMEQRGVSLETKEAYAERKAAVEKDMPAVKKNDNRGGNDGDPQMEKSYAKDRSNAEKIKEAMARAAAIEAQENKDKGDDEWWLK